MLALAYTGVKKVKNGEDGVELTGNWSREIMVKSGICNDLIMIYKNSSNAYTGCNCTHLQIYECIKRRIIEGKKKLKL